MATSGRGKFEYPKTFAKKVEDIPEGESFIILIPTTCYEEDRDPRDCWDVEVYENREKWLQAIEYKTLYGTGKGFVPIHSIRPIVEKIVSVEMTFPPNKS